MSDPCPVVLIKELAQMLGTSTKTIERRIRDRAFPIPRVHGIDNKYRWARSEVMAFIERGGVVQQGRWKNSA